MKYREQVRNITEMRELSGRDRRGTVRVPFEMQGRFLRVLQTGVFEWLGSSKSICVKVRIIAAANQPLERLVDEGRFRADLYYRLNLFPIALPPLRHRPSDIPLPVRHFTDKYKARFNRSITSISEQSLQALQEYYCAALPAAGYALQPQRSHQSLDRTVGNRDRLSIELSPDLACAVDLEILLIDAPNLRHEFGITPHPRRQPRGVRCDSCAPWCSKTIGTAR